MTTTLEQHNITINWTHIPNSISVWENLLSDFFDKRIQTQVGHYRFTYMLSHVGPKYDDLVNIYCHAHWGSPHPSFRRKDIWEAGTLQPMEHPEMLYLPPNLPGSTPKKPEMVKGPKTSRDKLLQALKIKYQDKAPYDVLMAQFYGTKIEPDEKCASFGTRLEQKLNQVSLQYPNKISESMYWNCVRERFFHGLSKDMRTNLRTQFDSGANYYRLLELARIVESESMHEDSKTEIKPTSAKGKGKVGIATVDSTSQQIQQLQGAVKGLTKMLQGNQQMTQTPQYVLQPTQNTVQEFIQNDVNILPQASPSHNSASFVNTQGVRGGRGCYRGRGSPILCYWCRDFLPKEQASHKVAQCPYQKQAKDSWWKNQLGNVQGETSAPQLENKES